MHDAVPADKLAQVWQQLTEVGGAFQSLGEPRLSKEAGYNVVYLPATWEHNQLTLKVVFNPQGQISGFWTLPPQ